MPSGWDYANEERITERKWPSRIQTKKASYNAPVYIVECFPQNHCIVLFPEPLTEISPELLFILHFKFFGRNLYKGEFLLPKLLYWGRGGSLRLDAIDTVLDAIELNRVQMSATCPDGRWSAALQPLHWALLNIMHKLIGDRNCTKPIYNAYPRKNPNYTVPMICYIYWCIDDNVDSIWMFNWMLNCVG